ncbi:exonuclease 3'-5' domain-containing protein 2 isoform X2 [Sitodiplosis mosellana]|uniref:exonuclease 3'-5' domain-containing protein 2 isoform X2 n=1 Tax=Sitodiplosis mosellana TaxID=263140 RepID=UPI002444814C|nr:exonuclease 3'-5' domain-containing protein 2 isoform X2 [Sitodiplosis mosellana]
MSEQNRPGFTTTTIAAAAAGIGLCFVVTKYRTQILKKLKIILNSSDPLRNQQIQVINNVEECRALMRNLKTHCDEFSVLGFDCEWVTVGGVRRPVALLQLTSHRGLCALVRLSHLQMIPSELKEVLEDDNILKVGVAPQGDASYLARDYGVCVASTFDLRYLAAMTGCKTGGLAKMSEDHLKVTLDKNWRIRCSDWEAPTLNEKQINYAATDAHVGIELFKFFAEKLEPKGFVKKQSAYVQRIIDEYCFSFIDLTYSGSQILSKDSQSQKTKKNQNGSSSVSLDKFKERKIATRQKPLYTNAFLQANDGELLCTIDQKKAMWYVNKNIGEIVAEDPLTVRLKFEPSGRAVGQTGKYYQTPKDNKCVVCGETEKYTRKNVVPREYRKNFPFVMKDHTSHDVLLLCPRCHQISNMHDLNLREKLAIECKAPFPTKNTNTKTVEVPRLKELKSICRALYFQRDKIPEERQCQLRAKLNELCPEQEHFSDEFLKSYIDIETTEMNENYYAHGEKVVEFYQKSKEGLVSLERKWREHFLHTMKPKFMPELWSVEHNVERLQIRANEGRIDEGDLVLAGLSLQTATD